MEGCIHDPATNAPAVTLATKIVKVIITAKAPATTIKMATAADPAPTPATVQKKIPPIATAVARDKATVVRAGIYPCRILKRRTALQ